MPISNIKHPRLRREMREALKRHILRERQRKADANKQKRRAEKAKAFLSSSKVQLEDNAKDILRLERTLVNLEQQKIEQYKLLKRALTDEDQRKHSQQISIKEPSWTSLYSPNLQTLPYDQHYLQSHRLLDYKPIPTTKRARSPSAHVFPSSQNQSAFSSAYPSYLPPTYTKQISRVRGASQMPNYLNSFGFLPQHPLLTPSKTGSIMNGYPLQSQQ